MGFKEREDGLEYVYMDFLGEKWKSLAEGQVDQIDETSEAVSAYESLKGQVHNLPDAVPQDKKELIQECFSDLQESIQRYIASIDAFTAGRIEKIDKEDMARLDENRHYAHNGLITTIEVLERLLKQESLDISWRSSVGYSRESIQEWAQKVTKHVSLSE